MNDSTIMFTIVRESPTFFRGWGNVIMLIILNIVGAYTNWYLKSKWLMWLNIIIVIISIYFILK
jgi:hypothetical protein